MKKRYDWKKGFDVILFAIQPLTYLVMFMALIGLLHLILAQPDYYQRLYGVLVWGIVGVITVRNVHVIADVGIKFKFPR